MNARKLILAALVLGLSAVPAAAQTARGTGGSDGPAEPAAGGPKEPDAKQLRQMYEDVAVFGALLNQAVEKSYGVPLRAPAHGPQGPRDHFHQFSLAEGVYLPGRGVVYSLTVPPVKGVLGTDAGPAAKEPSDWERARLELRGDQPAPPRDKAPRRPALSESVLLLLAENGRHFKELAEGEQITVAITFRGSDCVQCHTASGGGDPFRMGRGGLFSGKSAQQLGQLGGSRYGTGTTSPAASPRGQTLQGVTQAVRDGSTVGDLHLRQGRYKEAAQAYEQALMLLLREVKSDKTEADVQRLLAAVELARKESLALLALGDKAGAERVRGMSLKFADAAVKLAGSLKGGKAEKGSMPLPERLIVSAPKKLLEQAGTGKLSFAEFRKAAQVQHLRFPRPEK